ncbi:MAG: triose-phosphate isomerase [Patescibacteria group bacterium]
MTKLIVANWKLNPQTLKEVTLLAKVSDEENVVVAPPFPFLSAVKSVLTKAKLGSQDVFWEDRGAFTGSVSASQLTEMGVQYGIVGHSERRVHFGETDEMVGKKTMSLLRNGIMPVVCVGESHGEKEAGKRKEVIERELRAVFQCLGPAPREFIVAYEPIWAIGTGIADDPKSIEEAATIIRSLTQALHPGSTISVLYGGSVTSGNAEEFLGLHGIDGALVGGASLHESEITKIIAIAKNYA